MFTHNSAPAIGLLNEHQVAAYLNLSVATIRRWRLLKKGPAVCRLGAAVRYRPEDVEAFIGRAV